MEALTAASGVANVEKSQSRKALFWPSSVLKLASLPSRYRPQVSSVGSRWFAVQTDTGLPKKTAELDRLGVASAPAVKATRSKRRLPKAEDA